MAKATPKGNPHHEGRKEADIVPPYDVVDGVIKQADQTRDADNGQRLRAEQTKYNRWQSRREQSFVYAVEAVCAVSHVKSKGQRR